MGKKNNKMIKMIKKLLKTADEMYKQVEEISKSRKRAYGAAYEYKNIAEEAVLDRKLVLLKLKKAQEQWSPSESINYLHEQRRDISNSLDKLKLLEKAMTPTHLANCVYSNLSVDHLRRRSPSLQAVLAKQSFKFSLSLFFFALSSLFLCPFLSLFLFLFLSLSLSSSFLPLLFSPFSSALFSPFSFSFPFPPPLFLPFSPLPSSLLPSSLCPLYLSLLPFSRFLPAPPLSLLPFVRLPPLSLLLALPLPNPPPIYRH